jgi:hypothetical protein
MKARTPLTKVQRERLERFLDQMSQTPVDAISAADEIERILDIPPRLDDFLADVDAKVAEIAALPEPRFWPAGTPTGATLRALRKPIE